LGEGGQGDEDKNMKKPFNLDASGKIFENAKALRQEMTKEEKIMWGILRNRRLNGLKFRRQHPVLDYIVDFYCHEYKLIVEIDGGIHQLKENIEYDKDRTEIFEEEGLQVLRFTNKEILENIDQVKAAILNAPHPPTPSPEGEEESGHG